MCDILVATPRVTKNGDMIFAKNSDRDPNEAQVVEYVPPMKHEESMIKLTYVEFPQVERTYGIIISRPWWIWGAEMGINEHSLAIGNTAVFTNQKKEDVGILGMDMIRLALERCKDAKDALNFMVELIEKYGQGGSGSHEHRFLYHNSFIIAAPQDSYVLETAGKHWVSKKIDKFYTISNALTIEDDWDLASDSVESMSKKSSFSFSREFSDRFYTYFAHGRERRRYTYEALAKREGDIDLEYMMQILRSHNGGKYDPLHGSMRDVCMHYGGMTRPSQTASSQISLLTRHASFFTAESNPCLAIFKPFFFEKPYSVSQGGTDKYDDKIWWWRAEFFHRLFVMNYRNYIGEYSKDRDEVQAKVLNMKDTKAAFDAENELIKRWMRRMEKKSGWRYRQVWKKVNIKANISWDERL